MKYFNWHTDFQKGNGHIMFIRIMIVVGLAALALALIMVARGSHTVTPPLSAKPLGTNTLSHGGPSATPPIKVLPARPGDSANNQHRPGDTK